MEGGGKVTVTRALATNPLQLGALGVQIVAASPRTGCLSFTRSPPVKSRRRGGISHLLRTVCFLHTTESRRGAAVVEK